MLLADLQQKTTYPPQLLTNQTVAINTTLNPLPIRDTAAAPDLGYHYDPIDYITEMYAFTNATLTIASGTVIACYNDTGIWLQDGSAISSIGTPVAPNWFTYYLSVQEQSVSLGAYSNLYYAQDVTPYYVGNVPPNGVFQFSKFALPAGGIWQFYDRVNSSYGNLVIQDCEIWNGYNDFSGAPSATATVNNTLFARSRFYADDNASIGYSLSLSNNLFWGIFGGTTDLQIYLSAANPWSIFNNDFDTCRINVLGTSTTNGYNAYLNCSGDGRLYPTNINDIVTNVGLAYQTGPLGGFYQPTNSPLIDRGSESVDDAGLTGYTILTNQTPDTGTVDIGYHYAVIEQPVASDDPYEQPCENNAYDIDLSNYAYDLNGLTLTYIVVTPPTHGMLSNAGSGHFIYTPTSCYEGTDSFTYKVNDGYLESDTATVTLAIGDIVYTYYYPSPGQTCKITPLNITLVGYDTSLNGFNTCSDNPSTFAYTVLTNPANGVLTAQRPV